MQVIHWPRGGGKTKKLIEMADNYNGYIVCPSIRDVERIFKMAQDMGKKINFPLTLEDFKHRKYHAPGCKRFYIDDVDRCLQALSGVPIVAITVTKEEAKDDNNQD